MSQAQRRQIDAAIGAARSVCRNQAGSFVLRILAGLAVAGLALIDVLGKNHLGLRAIGDHAGRHYRATDRRIAFVTLDHRRVERCCGQTYQNYADWPNFHRNASVSGIPVAS